MFVPGSKSRSHTRWSSCSRESVAPAFSSSVTSSENVLAEMSQHVEAVHVGESEVEDHEIAPGGGVECSTAGALDVHLEPARAKALADEGRDAFLVLDDEDLHRGTSIEKTVSAPSRRA